VAAKDKTTVRIGLDEMGKILNLKENLDHHGQLWGYMNRYRAIGWDVAVIRARGGTELEMDLEQPEEDWWKQLADLGLTGVQVNLAIRTGRPSRLLVLEVNKGQGALSLDLLGDWRSQCVAELGDCREQHYYTLPPEQAAPPSYFMAQEVLIYGEDGLILAPPSIEPEGREPWSWLTPPWEIAPQPPNPAVWQFIREQLTGAGGMPEAPPWEEIYRVIASQDTVLKALLMPPTTMEQYYLDILQAGLTAGLRERQLLLGLLWHAPHGDARNNGERWKSLQGLLVSVTPTPEGCPAVPGPWPGAGASAAGSGPGWGPAPDPPALMVPGTVLTPGLDELTRQLTGENETEPATARFDKSVSGQFFQLLASLGEKVIAESCRNEALMLERETKPTELERLVVELEHCGRPGEAKSGPRPPGERGPAELLAAITPPHRKGKKLQEVKATVQDFLGSNPDLAGDQGKIQMVLFCLKNYVSINPDYAGLSFRDKLEKAGQMARSFLGLPPR